MSEEIFTFFILKEIKSILDKNTIYFWLTDKTLLDYYTYNLFINDISIGIFVEDWIKKDNILKEFFENGYKLIQQNGVEELGLSYILSKNNIKIYINMFYKNHYTKKNTYWCASWKQYKDNINRLYKNLYSPFQLVNVKIEGYIFLVPKDIKKYLQQYNNSIKTNIFVKNKNIIKDM